MNRRNIIQFKPEEVANIFAPTIKIEGAKSSKKKVDASNNDLLNNTQVNYPNQSTVSSQRQNMARQQEIKSNHDELYKKLFGNLLEGDYINTEDDDLVSAGGPVPSSGDTTNYKLLTQVGLTNLANCIEKGGVCVHRDNCLPKDKIGRCFTDNYTCCKNKINISGGQGSQTGTSAGTPSSSSTSTRSATAESSEDSLSSGYLRWQTAMTGTGSDYQQPNDTRVDRAMREQTTVRASSSYDYNNVTSVETSMDPYFCATFCNPTYDSMKGEWKVRPCEGQCAKCSNCGKEPEQTTTQQRGQRSSISKILFDNDRYTLNEFNRVDTNNSNREKNKLKQKINQVKAKIVNSPRDNDLKEELDKLNREYRRRFPECHQLSDVECARSKDCFNCISTSTSDDYSCKKHPDNNRIGVCDKKFASSCVPIYKEGDKFKADTVGPFRDITPYQDSMNYYSIDSISGVDDFKGLTHILEFPKKCKGPITDTYSFDSQYQDAIRARGFDIPSTAFNR